MNRILLIEDDALLRNTVKSILSNHYQVTVVSDVKQAKDAIAKSNFDLILTDLNLPDGSGLEICSFIKSQKNTPVLIVSGNHEISTKVAGFELGADDYIEKPFNSAELIARIKAKLRSARPGSSGAVTTKGDFSIDEQRHKIYAGKEAAVELNLSPAEFKLLAHFIKNNDQVFTRDQLISICSGISHAVTERSIDTQIYSLRKKIDSKLATITTIYGTGYSFNLVS